MEQVLLDTADSVMDTKRKVEFGVQQIIFKVGELVKVSGGEMDEQLKDQFADITRTILSNQTEVYAGSGAMYRGEASKSVYHRTSLSKATME